MNILLCPDKFKGSLSAKGVCNALEQGLTRHRVHIHPMADGGEGSLDVLSKHLQLQSITISTTDPLGRPINASYAVHKTDAFIELASASGLMLLEPNERNPLFTTTLGSGTMIADAINRGYKNIYLLLGGSATNDGGVGIATALGYRFLDEQGEEFTTGERLVDIRRIEKLSEIDLEEQTITLLCDVKNPLYGKQGAAHSYAQQKGASEEHIKQLDEGLNNLSVHIEQHMGKTIHDVQGVGAAGGVGACLHGLLGAKIQGGFQVIASITNLEKHIQQADWVISGEGKLDAQSLQGKVIDGVAKLCHKYEKPLALFVGQCDIEASALQHLGIKSVAAIADYALDTEDAITNVTTYLEKLARAWTERLPS